VTGVLAGGAPLCAECIAMQTGIPQVEVPSVIERARKTSRVETPYNPCSVCGTTRKVYQLHEPGVSHLRLVMLALWNERLCMTCLVAQTGVPAVRVGELLTALGRALTVMRTVAPCEVCSTRGEVLALV